MKAETSIKPNIRCLNCGKEWLTGKKNTPKFCQFCHSTKLKRFTELTDLKDKVNRTFPTEFQYRPNWGKTSKSFEQEVMSQ